MLIFYIFISIITFLNQSHLKESRVSSGGYFHPQPEALLFSRTKPRILRPIGTAVVSIGDWLETSAKLFTTVCTSGIFCSTQYITSRKPSPFGVHQRVPPTPELQNFPNMIYRWTRRARQRNYYIKQFGKVDVWEPKMCQRNVFIYFYQNWTDCRQIGLHRTFCLHTKWSKYFRVGRVLLNYIVLKSFAQKIAQRDTNSIYYLAN
jgi:hypothetical protein